MDPDEVIRALVSVGLVVTLSLGANCQSAVGGAPVARPDLHPPVASEIGNLPSGVRTVPEQTAG